MGPNGAPYLNSGEKNLVGNQDIARLYSWLQVPMSVWVEVEKPPFQCQSLVPMAGKYVCQYACMLCQNVVLHNKASV